MDFFISPTSRILGYGADVYMASVSNKLLLLAYLGALFLPCLPPSVVSRTYGALIVQLRDAK